MDSFQLDRDGDCLDDMHVDHLDPSNCDEFQSSDILPRIGDQFQVKIPPLIETSDYVSTNFNNNLLIGLPIPVKWISHKQHGVSSSRQSKVKNVNKTNTYSNGENLKTFGKSRSSEKIRPCGDVGSILVPGLSDDYWSDLQKASFLLGLYIFEKNFVEVRRFIETKKMGSILCYYYGEFYGSVEYLRWSKRKMKKCVYGRRIFSGLRRKEIVSRILSSVSEERKNAILEVSKTFGDGKMSLPDYVASLKAMVGINVLVESIGIGKGKKDLTRIVVEFSKSDQVISTHSEIPIGKSCSCLTTSEIIQFLSADYRLSKTRSNDLFWEAVWPRLLARGWHSEQPKDQGYYGNSGHCLVFLVSGVKKFSRRKLVKGDHYFDSVSDVLSRVAKDPGLIELDAEEGKVEKDDNDLPTNKWHSYLQPRIPNRNADVIKFTVVDTSLYRGKIRELKTLPFELCNMSNIHEFTEHSDEEDTTGEFDTITTVLSNSSVSNNVIFKKNKSIVKMLPSKKTLNDLRENKKSRNQENPVSSRKLKRDNKDIIASVPKKYRRLTTCGREENREGKNGSSSSCSGIQEVTKNLSFGDKSSSTSSSKCGTIESAECTPNAIIQEPEFSKGTLIDLNLPQVPPDFENGFFITEPIKGEKLGLSSLIEAKSEQPIYLNSRRHGTRNRPPTTRALEALANGYLTVNKRRKCKENGSHENQSSISLQRNHGGLKLSADISVASSRIQETDNGVVNSGVSNMLQKYQDPSEAN